MSNRKLAEALGVSETAVRKALAAGRISREADGSFDIARAKRQWAGSTDAAQQRPATKAGPGLRPVPAAALASLRETLRDQGEEPAPGGPSFLQARTANEVLKAQERKLRLARLKGELIDRARATAQVFTLARQERDAWVQWPARMATLEAQGERRQHPSCCRTAEIRRSLSVAVNPATLTAMRDVPPSLNDTWYKRSCREPALGAPSLDGRRTAAIGIVGGGLAGLALALALAERGATPVLLEAATVGAGASGRNGGLLSAGFTRGFADLRRRLGEADAREVFRLSHAAVGLVGRRIAAGAIACRPRYGVLEASWFDRPGALEAEVEEQNRLFGRELRFWPRAQLRQLYRSARYHDGIFDPQARHLDPLALSRGYARLARAAGATIFEQSPVERLERLPGRAGWRAVTRTGGALEADQLVLATNAASLQLARELGRGLIPVNTYIIVSEPLPDARELPIRAAYAVYDDRFATGYYRLTEDRATGGRRLLWGGRIGLGAAPADLARRLRADLALVYPELADLEIAHAWAGQMGFARHRMPVVAPLAPGLWVTTGFAGHGLNTTTMAGELLAAALVDGSDQWRLLAPFGLAWTGGPLGPLAAQALYHGRALEEDLVAFWHRHRPRRRPAAPRR